jgi:hypothetical protein
MFAFKLPEIVEITETLLAKQAVHSTATDRLVYGRSTSDVPGLAADVHLAYYAISKSWSDALMYVLRRTDRWVKLIK